MNKAKREPRVFIGSSSESYGVASACNEALDWGTEVTLWDKIFKSGSSTLESLVIKANNVDFALFVFSPDDVTRMRGNEHSTVRDNVLFELGLFIGAIGSDRCFILKPRGEELHIPSDLLGVTIDEYNDKRSDNEIHSAVGAPCSKMRRKIDELGLLRKEDVQQYTASLAIKKGESVISEVNDEMLRILSELLCSQTEEPSVSYYNLKNNHQPSLPHKFEIALIKLARLQLIDKSIEEDFNGNSCYAYSLTSDGVEFLLENETRLDLLLLPVQQVPQQALQQLRGAPKSSTIDESSF